MAMLRWPSFAGAVGALLLASLVACGGSDDTAGSQDLLGAASPSGLAFAAVEVSQQRLPTLMDSASDSERAALEDGVITFAEYEGATLQAVGCLAEYGMGVVSPPHLTSPPREGLFVGGRGQYRYAPVRSGEGVTGDDVIAAQGCLNEFSSVLQAVWMEATTPTVEEINEAREEVAACLRMKGFQIDSELGPLSLDYAAFPPDGVARGRPLNPEYKACIEPVIAAYGLFVPAAGF